MTLSQMQRPPIRHWEDAAFTAHQLHVDVLRTDLLHPVISGNKWLKLQGYLQQMERTGKKGILTKGGPWSNHVHACAYACNLAGVECHLWVKAAPQMQTPTLQDCIAWGATIRHVNRSEFYDEPSAMAAANEMDLLYIPMGGADAIGIAGVTTSMQAFDLPHYDHAICAMGTGTTFAGLAYVPDNFDRVTGIDSGTHDDALKQKLNEWQSALPQKELNILFGQDGGGYARYDEDQISFMNRLHETHGIPTDIVYTGKLFMAVQRSAAAAIFPAQQRILIIHSGGLQGNRSLPKGLLHFV